MESDLDFLLKPSPQFERMLRQESGNQQFGRDGQPLTSSAGARGVAQVMPGTGPEAAKLAGVDWNPELFNRGRTGDPDKDGEATDYNRKLGQAYYNEQLRVFGDPNIASAAYNAGPGAVRVALDRAKKDGGNYLDYLPKETQHYVGVVGRSARAYPAPPPEQETTAAPSVSGDSAQSPPTKAEPKRDPVNQFFHDLAKNARPLEIAGFDLPPVRVTSIPGLQLPRNLPDPKRS
jgi:hypothetical protein